MLVRVDEGPDRGMTGEIADERFTIGRHPSCDLALTDDQASSRHAALERSATGDLTLVDLGSTNGTFVNGKRVQGPLSLHGNERITLGRTVLGLSEASDGSTVMGAIPAAPEAFESADAVLAGPEVVAPASARATPQEADDTTDRRSAPRPKRPVWPRRRLAAGVGAGGVVLVAAVVAVILLTGGSAAKPHRLAASETKKVLGLQQLIAQATPSVVRILGKIGGGSGFVIDAKRQLVLTNAHVAVGGMYGDSINSGLTAQVGNDATTDTPARLIAASPCDDLAVVQLVNPVPGLKAMSLGSSSTVHPGDQVIVLGYPASGLATQAANGQAPTVNSNEGIVSATQAQAPGGPSSPNYQDVIQHQAPINPGNSGGPLLNREGQVIGINSLGSLGTQGQYYSIAINYAKRLLPDLENGHSHSLIGWSLTELSSQDQNLAQELEGYFSQEPAYKQDASQWANDTAGFLEKNGISGVLDTGGDSAQNGPGTGDMAGSPADKAGTQGFLIDAINNVPVNSVQDVCDILNSANAGQHLSMDAYNIDNPANHESVILTSQGKPDRYTLNLIAPGS